MVVLIAKGGVGHRAYRMATKVCMMIDYSSSLFKQVFCKIARMDYPLVIPVLKILHHYHFVCAHNEPDFNDGLETHTLKSNSII
jgi:hypothetical protein